MNDKLPEFKKRLDLLGNEIRLLPSEISWLITEVEGLREDLEMYQTYLDREKDLYSHASEKRKDYEKALKNIKRNLEDYCGTVDNPRRPTMNDIYETYLIVMEALKS